VGTLLENNVTFQVLKLLLIYAKQMFQLFTHFDIFTFDDRIDATKDSLV